MRKALGLIETIGLVTAIEAADAAVKSANVTLLGYENTRGGGKITVKVVGDVGAVQAAVAAGVAAAERIGKVYGKLIIPRPTDEIDALIASVARGKKPEPVAAPVVPKPEPVVAPVAAPVAAPMAAVEPVVEPEPCPEPQAVEEAPEPVAEVALVEAPAADIQPAAEAAEEPELPVAEPPASAPVNPARGKAKPRGGKRR